MRSALACPVLLLAFALAGCSGTDEGACTPGDSRSCTCSGGGTGTETCESDGSGFGECVCMSTECSASNPNGTCSSGSSCVDGECCATARVCGGDRCCTASQTCMGGLCVTPCSASSPNGFCDGGMTCTGGTCCATERACGSTCCPSGESCQGGSCAPPVCSSANPTGTCAGGSTCVGGACCPTARVCGTSSPTCCGTDQTCTSGQCVGQCVPSCGQAECGPNGCGGQCGMGACPSGLTCQAGSCTLDGSTVWQVIVKEGMVVRNDDWDLGGGAPDPTVCATVDTAKRCTPVATDTYEPGRFNEWGSQGTIIAETSAAKLQAGIPWSYEDEDIQFNDEICAGSKAFNLMEFRMGTGRVSCPTPASYWNFTLKPKNP